MDILKETQQIAEKTQEKNLSNMVKTKNKQEYSSLYNTYIQQKEFNKKNKAAINHIEYALKNKDYNATIKELKNYQNLQNEIIKTNQQLQNTISYAPVPGIYMNPAGSPDWTKPAVEQAKKAFNSYRRTALHDYPKGEKRTIGLGMWIKGSLFKKAYDAKELWKAASHNFSQSNGYINKNGYILDTVNYLKPDNLQTFVKNKLQKQMGVDDAKGIMFMPYSSFSIEISKSPELQHFIKTNLQSLLSRQSVTGSTYFTSNENLGLSLGHADIYDAYIDDEGNFHAYIVDTYDFNKNDSNWAVEWARNVQENSLITNFYTIHNLSIPKEQWIKYINL